MRGPAQHDKGRNIVLFSQVISTEPLPPVTNENGWTPLFGEPREPGIRYVPESLMVHRIEKVKVTTKDTKVVGGELELDIDDFYERGY